MAIETLPLKELKSTFPNSRAKPVEPPFELYQKEIGQHYRYEMEVMARLCAWQNTERAFEFGTFNGFTTLVLAMNSQPEAEIFTLDLPREGKIETAIPLEHYNLGFVRGRGQLYFKGHPCEGKITPIYHDSMRLNARYFRSSIDLIFVDGNHQKPCVEKDSKNAFEMSKPGGIILWHDYKSSWPDVTPYLEKLSKTRKLVHIKGTNYAMFRNI